MGKKESGRNRRYTEEFKVEATRLADPIGGNAAASRLGVPQSTAAVMDLASRRIVGWSMSERMKAELVCDALKSAYWGRKPTAGLLMHTERGSHPGAARRWSRSNAAAPHRRPEEE